MDCATALPADIETLTALVLTQRQCLAERDETIAQLEQQNRVLAKGVFGRSSEKRVPEPSDPALQGNRPATAAIPYRDGWRALALRSGAVPG